MPSEGRISAIEPQGRDSGLVAIYVDGVKQLTVHRAALKSLGLEEGATVDADELRQLAAAAERRAGMDAGLALLGVRDRTAKELSERLRRKSFTQEVAGDVLGRLQELGYVDDRRYAVEFVRGRMVHRPAGRHALRGELRRKGVEAETIDEVLDECFDGVDEVAVAVGIVQQRARRFAGLDTRTARSRLVSLLQRRGFDFEVIQEAVTRAMPEIDTDEDVASPGE